MEAHKRAEVLLAEVKQLVADVVVVVKGPEAGSVGESKGMDAVALDGCVVNLRYSVAYCSAVW